MNENETLFLEHVKCELSLNSSIEAVPLISSVLQAFRQTLNYQNAEALLKRLPEFFRGYFMRGWVKDEPYVKVVHLDELVTLVMERDKESGRILFKDEVQTLSVILLTLKRIFRFIDPRSVVGISQPLCQELSEAATEIP